MKFMTFVENGSYARSLFKNGQLAKTKRGALVGYKTFRPIQSRFDKCMPNHLLNDEMLAILHEGTIMDYLKTKFVDKDFTAIGWYL